MGGSPDKRGMVFAVVWCRIQAITADSTRSWIGMRAVLARVPLPTGVACRGTASASFGGQHKHPVLFPFWPKASSAGPAISPTGRITRRAGGLPVNSEAC